MTTTGDLTSERPLLRGALLAPASVALVGASDDPRKASARPLMYLQRRGFRGDVYPVNPSKDQVMGVQAWPSLGSLPAVPEHAFVMVPTLKAVDAVRECVELGVDVVTVLADGFTEGGEDGATLTGALREALAGSRTRLIGPSSLGVVNLRNGFTLSANPAFGEVDLPTGGTLAVSQSGSMMGALASRGMALGIGFASLISVGNEIDVNVGEICLSSLDDEGITGYILFLESISGADQLRQFAAAAQAKGRPIVAYKLGRSSVGAELTVTHTGALAGEEQVSAAFLADCGIARVTTLDGLLEGVSLAGQVPIAQGPRRRPRVGVVSTTGGGAAMVVDQLGVLGIETVAPSADLFEAMARNGAPARPARIVDLTLAGARYQVMHAALRTLIDAGEHDLLLVVVGSSARAEPETAVRPIVELAGAGMPLAAFLVPEAPEGLALLRAAGVPCFRTPEACADAVRAVLSRRDPAALAPLDVAGSAGSEAPQETITLDEQAAYGVLEGLGVPHAPTAVLASFDGAVPDLPVQFPVAVKVLSATLAHKSDVGGVVLGVPDPASLKAAVKTIHENVAAHRPDLVTAPVLVQSMVEGLAEVLVGYRLDPHVGPIVLVAPGGELAETNESRSIRLAPVNRESALEMIDDVRSLAVLRGYRGRPPADVDALADVIVALSQLATRGEVTEAEVNPVVVRAEGLGVVAVDALVRRRSTVGTAPT